MSKKTFKPVEKPKVDDFPEMGQHVNPLSNKVQNGVGVNQQQQPVQMTEQEAIQMWSAQLDQIKNNFLSFIVHQSGIIRKLKAENDELKKNKL